MNTTHKQKVGIVVLNYNNFNDTKECLESLDKISYTNYFIVVVDNNSNPFIFNKLKELFPSLTFVRNKQNLGYSAGNNVGIRYCLNNDADYILILNNDILVTQSFLEPLVEAMSNDSIGIVGPKIYRFEDQKIVQKPLQQVNILTKKVGARWVPDDTSDYPTTNFSVAKLAGSCLLLKRKAIEDVGVFNENFFLYYADTDLQKRMGQSGWKLYNIPHSVILHKHSKTTSSTILLQYYYDSRDFLFYVLEYHPVALAWCLPYSLIYSTLFRAPFKHHDVPFLKKIRAVLLGYLHFLENKRGMQAHTFSSLHKEPGVFRYWVSFYDPVVHTPVTQVSGLCFNKDGKILMIGSHHWNIPGGKPEVGETVEETLVREVREESNVEITHFEPLGVMMIIYPNNPNKKEGEIFYQLRFIAKIEKINTQIPDPAGGKIRKRMFVEPEKCIEYVNWGYEAERMFDSAKKLYYQKK